MNKHNHTSIIEQFVIFHQQNEFLSFCGPVGYIHRRQLTIVLLLQRVVHIISVIIFTFHSRLRCATGLEVLQLRCMCLLITLPCVVVRVPSKPLIIKLTLKSLTLYIYGAPILDVSRLHTTTQHSR